MIRNYYFGESLSPSEGESRKNLIIKEEPKIVEVVDNRIYFYAPIEGENVLNLNKTIREIDNNNIVQKIKFRTDWYNPIYLHVNSGGGYILDGICAMDNLLQLISPLYTIVDGHAASAATFLTIIGKKRYITRRSVMLIHQLSSFAWGTYDQLKDDIKNCDLLMDILRKIYKEYTKIPQNKLDEILKHDLYFDAEECITYGLVDKII